jgi:tetratricopeptide (TPR) repeat protein
MVRRTGRPSWQLIVAVLAVVLVAVPALAQPGGIIRGIVRDDKGQPIDGASVIIEMTSTGRRYEIKTNRKGEYLQIGLASGEHKVSARKDKLASAPTDVTVRIGQPTELNFTLGAGGAGGGNAELSKKAAELKKLFDEGVAASSAGRHGEAIERFNQAVLVSPDCSDCYNNIGFSHMQQKEYDQAEAAYKKASEIKPDDANAYSGLANIYNAQRKFDLAAQASAKATELSGGAAAGGGGGSAEAQFNQGVILWNAGKIPDAKKAFEAAIKADPNHAESHYQLGMALVNEGNLQAAAGEFETYLKLAPSGPNAATAKSLVAQLKK